MDYNCKIEIDLYLLEDLILAADTAACFYRTLEQDFSPRKGVEIDWDSMLDLKLGAESTARAAQKLVAAARAAQPQAPSRPEHELDYEIEDIPF